MLSKKGSGVILTNDPVPVLTEEDVEEDDGRSSRAAAKTKEKGAKKDGKQAKNVVPSAFDPAKFLACTELVGVEKAMAKSLNFPRHVLSDDQDRKSVV